MRRTVDIVLMICALAALCLQICVAQGPPPPPASGRPGPGGNPFMMGGRALVIGPKDRQGKPRPVRGKIVAMAILPQDSRAASVEIYLDQTLLGKATQAPFKADCDTATVPDGNHTFKAVGRDANGQIVWTAVTEAAVSNNSKDAPSLPTKPEAPAQPSQPAPSPTPVVHQPNPQPISLTQAATLGKTFDGAKYGFSIRYPGSWTAKDETPKIKPKKPGSAWLVLKSSSEETSPMTVNVRCERLSPGTDAETFAKYNNYVSSWDRKTVLGSPAFATTSGTQQSKRVIHRLIIIKDGCSWMLNCIDTTGMSPEMSKKLFDSMVDTLTIATRPSVTVTPVK